MTKAWQRRNPHKIATKEQRSRWNLNSRYGLTPKQVREMIEKQGGLCALCGCPLDNPVVDHDHDSGKVGRGCE